MFKTFWDWFLAIGIFIVLVFIFGEFYSFYRDRRSSALFAALSYLIIGIGLTFYFGSSLWLRFIIGPIVFLFAIIIYWTSYSARKDERMPRPIFLPKTKKEKEADKQSALAKKRTAEISATATIAAEKRAAVIQKPAGAPKPVPRPVAGTGGGIKIPPTARPGGKT